MKSIALWAIAFLVEFHKLLRIRKSLQFYRKLISQIRALEVIRIGELKRKVGEGLLKVGDFVLCQGRVTAEGAIRTILGKTRKQAVYSELVMDKVFEIRESRNTVRKGIRKLFTGLLRLMDNGERVNMFETAGTTFLPTQFLKKTVSYRERIFNFGWLISLLLKSPTRVISNVYLESFIPEGAEVTVFSKIMKGSLSEVEFSRPIAMAGSKEHMVAYYKDILEFNTYLSYALYLLIVGTLYLFYKFYLKPKLTHPSFLLGHRTGLERVERIEVKDLNCSVCQSVLSNMIYTPCGHLNICDNCNVIKGEKECLECSRKPREVIQVYPC